MSNRESINQLANNNGGKDLHHIQWIRSRIRAHINDSHLDDDSPSLGACRRDLRKSVNPGDLIFIISGKVNQSPLINQFVLAGFEVAEKMDAQTAFFRFPERHLKLRSDGQLDGNVIVDESGIKHPLDRHSSKGIIYLFTQKSIIINRNRYLAIEINHVQESRA